MSNWRPPPIDTDVPSLAYDGNRACVRIIDQTRLPARLVLAELRTLSEFCDAIAAMRVRGAPLIGVTAAFGLALSLRDEPTDETLQTARARLSATRPTAVNLSWALDRVCASLVDTSPADWFERALAEAQAIAAEDVAACRAIGEHGVALLESLAQASAGPVNILTHCNAGRLATLAWGTATAPIYLAHQRGLPVHVWVSETRPRNQGASLTAWELQAAGVSYTVVADNASGALMQTRRVDCVLVGSDRTAANGDVCNKIGTYMKAVLAREHDLPFFAAVPLSTLDWNSPDGSAIPIATGDGEGDAISLPLSVAEASAWNPAFDVTPARLVSAIITEAGTVPASLQGLAGLRRRLAARRA